MAPAERVRTRGGPLTWVLRVTWLVLPLALGPAVSTALDDWGNGPQITAEGMLWAAWGLGVLAVLAPRAWGLTVLRALAVAALVLAGVSAVAASTAAAALGLAATALAWATASTAEVADDFVNGAAYGDERRMILRHPRVVGLVLAPLSSLIVVAGLATGPLLVADGRLVAGVPALVVGVVVAAFLARSLHALSGRWLVFVPGGVVVHDRLVLADPVLLPRDRLRHLGPLDSVPASGAADLRLGARGGEIGIELFEAAQLPLARRGRIEATSAPFIVVSLARPGTALAEAARRGLPVS